MKKLTDIKIAFIDIDGTLVNDKNKVLFRTKRSIKKLVERGVLVVITSGRHFNYCVNMSKLACASHLVIASNGAKVYDYLNDETLYSNYVSFEKVNLIYDYCAKNEIGLAFNTNLGRYINRFLLDSKYKGQVITEIDKFIDFDISQCVFICDSYDKLLMCKEFVNGIDLDIAYISKSFHDKSINDLCCIDALNKGVSKGNSAKFIMDRFGIKKEESICFGDYINDLDLFDACGYKVAMGNACDELKEKADFITLSNNKNGIGYFIDKYIL